MAERAHWTIADLLQATEGERVGEGVRNRFEGIAIDSRTITETEVFVAIEGAVHDGHRFVGDVLNRGVQGLVLKKEKVSTWSSHLQEHHAVCIAVDDTTAALGRLGSFHRRRCGVETVAITGSNGKTTTRCMVSNVFEQGFRTLSTTGNLNNEIGVPLTLFQLDPDHEWAVLELGMNHPGEIRRLGTICRPRIGLITNIGPAHLEGLGSIEGVLRAKAELLEAIADGGIAVLNADDPRLLALARETSVRTVLFGVSEKADVRALNIEAAPDRTRFDLAFQGQSVSVTLRVPGRFMVSNSLAAAAAGLHAGLGMEPIRAGLERFTAVKGRMNVIRTNRQFFIVDDTYNANPGSMEAALVTLRGIRGDGRGILVAGDMLELGSHAEELHREIGRLAVRSGIDRIYATGQYAQVLASGARAEGFADKHIFTGGHEAILEDLSACIQESDWVLVKGSRAMGMERIVAGLKDEPGTSTPADQRVTQDKKGT